MKAKLPEELVELVAELDGVERRLSTINGEFLQVKEFVDRMGKRWDKLQARLEALKEGKK